MDLAADLRQPIATQEFSECLVQHITDHPVARHHARKHLSVRRYGEFAVPAMPAQTRQACLFPEKLLPPPELTHLGRPDRSGDAEVRQELPRPFRGFTVLIDRDYPEQGPATTPRVRVKSLPEAVAWILGNSKEPS